MNIKRVPASNIDSDLQAVRNQIVVISAQYHVTIPEIVSKKIIFTDQELRQNPNVAALTAPAPLPVSQTPVISPRDSMSTSDDNPQSLHSHPASRLRTAPQPEFIDDDEIRRSSVAPEMAKQYESQNKRATAVNVVGKAPESVWVVDSRPFGVEMETLLFKKSDEYLQDNHLKAIRDVIPALQRKLGDKFKFFDYQAAKDDRLFTAWKITTDLSIRSEDGRPIFGLEFITPKMSGGSALLEVEMVCDELINIGFSTNTSTALHVHVSVEDFTNAEILRQCEYQIAFEHVIDQFVTLPRRQDYSRYCRSNMRSISTVRSVDDALKKLSHVDVSKGLSNLIHVFCPRLSSVYNSHRNHKVNLLLLTRTKQNTPGRRIEFRQHQGSCDRQEIGAWVSLLNKWVNTCRKLPPPISAGTTERFWQIINDDKLKTYFTVKAQMLPSSVDFTYDSRELYAFDTNDVEPSDLDDDEATATGRGAQRTAVLPQAVGAPGPIPPVRGEASPHFVRETVAVTREAIPPPVIPPPTVSFSPAEKEKQKPDTSVAMALPSTLFPDSLSSEGSEGNRVMSVSSMSCAEEIDINDNSHMRNLQMRGQGASVEFDMGNFMFSCAVKLCVHYFGESIVAAHSDVTINHPLIAVADVEDAKDARRWFITPPTESSHLNRRHRGIRFVSPWITEAKAMEATGLVVSAIESQCQLDEEMFGVVYVAVNHYTNSEIGRVCAAVLIYQKALSLFLCSEKPAPSVTTRDEIAAILQMSDASDSQGQGYPPSVVNMMLKTDLIHLDEVQGTKCKDRKRSLKFFIGQMNAEKLARKVAFLSYFVSYFAKKVTNAVVQQVILRNYTPSELITTVDTLPTSLARTLAS